MVGCQQFSHDSVESDRGDTFLVGILLGKVLGQMQHIFATATQGGDLQANNVDAVVKIFAKPSRSNFRNQIPVGGGHHPNIGMHGTGRANGPVFTVLQEVQQLGLQGQRHLPDFIEKKCSFIGQGDQANATLIGPRVSAFLGAK